MASKLQLAGFLVAVGVGGTATADVETMIEVVPGPGTPMLEATIRGAGVQPLDAIALRDPRGVTVAASAIMPFAKGKESIAIAFVIEGGEVWLGNDEFEPEDSPARYFGTLNGIRAGLDRLDLGRTMPRGSAGMIVTYDTFPRMRVPLGPIGQINGAAMGTQRDHYGHLGQSQAAAIALAMAELETASTHKKLLIVIGDGNDTNNEAAKGQLADLKKRAAMHRIDVAAIVYKGYLSSPETVITHLTPRTVTANSMDSVEAEIREAVRRSTSQYTVRFPGERLRWDGTVQELSVQLGFIGTEPVPVKMGTAPPRPEGTPWYLTFWAQLAAGMLLVGAIVAAQRLRGRSAL